MLYKSFVCILNFPTFFCTYSLPYLFTSVLTYFFKNRPVLFPRQEVISSDQTSVVTVLKILLSVGFGRFCKKNRGFRFGFGFCLSRFLPVVNVVRLCGPLHIKPAAVCYIFLCITPVDSSKYPTAWDWWRENHHLYPTSHVLQNATCLAVCATDIRC